MEFIKYSQRDEAALLYGNAVTGIIITFITSTFLVFSFNSPLTVHVKQLWWVVMTTLLAIRMLDVINWKTNLQHIEFDGKKSINRFISGVYPTAIMWSVYLTYIATHNSGFELTTTIITVSGIAGGSSMVLAAHKRTAMFYAFILPFPASITLLLSGEESIQLLGLLAVFFSVTMLISSKKSADFTARAVFLKNENENLLHHMEDQVEQRTQRIYELSNLDPLTLLFNRTAFLSNLKSVIDTSNKPLALLFIDLDGFKQINDSFGHKAGDEILRKTADRLKKSTQNEQLLCRWGGDEFLIAMTDVSETIAVGKAKQLIKNLSNPHTIDNSVLSVGATIGISLFPDHGTSEERLINTADMAMYYQKKIARSSVSVFSKEMEKIYSHEQYLKNELANAIDKQQLRLVFQPLVLADNKKVASFEALLRWQLDGEEIPPEEFTLIAEKYGLINKIGAWVILNACLQASQWDIEKKLAVCVNVSVVQLHDEHFIDMIDHALSTSSLSSELLHIEITESVFASDVSIISKQIKRLQSRGVKVAIDDFGTGFSSLSVIQDLAVDLVKIDRLFVEKLNENGSAIISAVMHIASSLDFLVIAEGVENEVQAQALSKLGVHYLQGYHYSKPIEIEDISNYLNEEHE